MSPNAIEVYTAMVLSGPDLVPTPKERFEKYGEPATMTFKGVPIHCDPTLPDTLAEFRLPAERSQRALVRPVEIRIKL